MAAPFDVNEHTYIARSDSAVSDYRSFPWNDDFGNHNRNEASL